LRYILQRTHSRQSEMHNSIQMFIHIPGRPRLSVLMLHRSWGPIPTIGRQLRYPHGFRPCKVPMRISSNTNLRPLLANTGSHGDFQVPGVVGHQIRNLGRYVSNDQFIMSTVPTRPMQHCAIWTPLAVILPITTELRSIPAIFFESWSMRSWNPQVHRRRCFLLRTGPRTSAGTCPRQIVIHLDGTVY
jgi:hypothetical protein